MVKKEGQVENRSGGGGEKVKKIDPALTKGFVGEKQRSKVEPRTQGETLRGKKRNR